jgi:uncharacterized protein
VRLVEGWGADKAFDLEERLTDNVFRLRLHPDSTNFLVRLYPFGVFEFSGGEPGDDVLGSIQASAATFQATEPFTYFQPLLVLTSSCNLACSYCYAHEGSYGQIAEVMSSEVIQRTLRFLEETLDAHHVPKIAASGLSEVGVICFGGEPLLALERLREVHRHTLGLCENLSKRWKHAFKPLLTLNTNAYAVSDEACDFLEQIRDCLEVVVSFDGWTHDRNRLTKDGEASSGRVLENLLRLRDAAVDVSVTCCVLPEAVSDPARTLAGLECVLGRGIPTNLSFIRGPLEVVKGRALYPGMVQETYETSSLTTFGVAVANAIRAGAPIYSRRYRRRLLEGGYRYRCGAGLFEFAVLPNGDVYPCHNFIAPGYKLGNILNQGFRLGPELQPGLLETLRRRTVTSLDPCRRCVLQTTCMSSFDCPAHSQQDLGDMSLVDIRFCGFARKVQGAILETFLVEQSVA